jgi:hypothetical protein
MIPKKSAPAKAAVDVGLRKKIIVKLGARVG